MVEQRCERDTILAEVAIGKKFLEGLLGEFFPGR